MGHLINATQRLSTSFSNPLILGYLRVFWCRVVSISMSGTGQNRALERKLSTIQTIEPENVVL